MKKHILAAAIAATMLSACGDNHTGWSIDGNIADADGATLAVETFSNGRWVVVDSVATDADGDFCYNAPAPAPYPEIMRLSLDGSSIYFPVDSVDCLHVTTSRGDFAGNYTLEGSAQASAVRAVDSIINAALATRPAAELVQDSLFKRQLFQHAFDEPSVITLYYVINKSVGGLPLYNIANNFDRRLYRAVAQRFSTERPDDPRTTYMVQQVASLAAAGTTTTITVPETGLFDIVRYDVNGGRHSLAESVEGKVTVLSFTSYELEASAAYNVLLNEQWEKHHAAGLEIFQVAFDADETMWRVRAANLPWTAVWNANADGTDILVQYNVGMLPMTFIIDRNGQLVERIADPTTLGDSLKKYL